MISEKEVLKLKESIEESEKFNKELIQMYPKILDDLIFFDQKAKSIIIEYIVLPIKFSDTFKGYAKCNTFLLFGPKGNYMDLYVKYAASLTESKLLIISLSDIKKFPKNIDEILKFNIEKIPTNTRIFILLENIEKLFEINPDLYTNAEISKARTELLYFLDNANKDKIMILGTSENPWDIHETILRRFTKRIQIRNPNIELIQKILEKHLAVRFDTKTIIIDKFAKKFLGCTMKEILNIIDFAYYELINNKIPFKKDKIFVFFFP